MYPVSKVNLVELTELIRADTARLKRRREPAQDCAGGAQKGAPEAGVVLGCLGETAPECIRCQPSQS